MSLSQWKIEKKASHEIIDQQDDPGMGWDKIAHFWPEDMPEPDIGMKAEDHECCTEIIDGMDKEAKYPMKTPEDALASSMYLVTYGVDSLDKEAAKDIAGRLKNARDAHGVELPDEFKEFAKTASPLQEEKTDLYADERQNLPITTEKQASESIDVFEKYANRWGSKERAKIASRLERAADKHDLNKDVPYTGSNISKTASRELKKREEVAKTISEEKYEDADISKDKYLAKVAFMRNQIKNPAYDLDREDIYNMVETLEVMDKQAGMDVAWNRTFEDPTGTFFEKYDQNIYNKDNMEKSAKSEKLEDLSNVDASDLNGLEHQIDEEVVEEIKRDPETVIPTLPMELKGIVKEHISNE